MGNCIGKKSRVQNKHHRYSSPSNNQLSKIQILPSLSDQSNILVSDNDDRLSQCKNSVKNFNENITLITNEEDEKTGYLFNKEIKSGKKKHFKD